MKLLAKHTLQSGLSAKTAAENEALRGEAEALRRENNRLAEQVGGGAGRAGEGWQGGAAEANLHGVARRGSYA